jgi:hypothetical protein
MEMVTYQPCGHEVPKPDNGAPPLDCPVCKIAELIVEGGPAAAIAREEIRARAIALAKNPPPLLGYESHPVLNMLIQRATGAMMLLSLNTTPDPVLKFESMKALRRALERATGKDFGSHDLSRFPADVAAAEDERRHLLAAFPDLFIAAKRVLKEIRETDNGDSFELSVGAREDLEAAVAKVEAPERPANVIKEAVEGMAEAAVEVRRERLFAAAPELLALAKDCFTYLASIEEGLPPGAPPVERFEQVIAKAEGRELADAAKATED